MIDGLMKDVIDPLWERMAQPLVRAGLTPNQVTAAGLALILLASGAYLLHQSAWVFGLTLAVAFAFDALDGAVARQRGMMTKLGGYFDAMVDRYQELVVLGAIAWVSGHWALALLGFSGAMLTSYAKARTAIEVPVDNAAWPDLFERLERVIYLCVMLVLVGVTGADWLLASGLALYAALCHFTALQRMRRAAALLAAVDADKP
ncbi:CDP-diacylglycerol--glycerol-3-phosphate 3-phosphatidyltransferase [Candidatus Rhodobacter oscarellae]|uniref:CDP-diacylglycerol--glycerol-3-phosphate 3-phosphatidyltransferase n=1 Tax=Candidatus Rhodobacter oscarellae TaxID=1675527 RepID=A0A0J9E3K0_9RHOB|nr:CDP-alcohol phosphatidyltransferase family protein [Candidatus Rhodobacter lobularis]KMW57396.1 CDP-diacylglycerol--glycerol-3-phosphate 3-phosphatidyltransferase [Candidatus Rhodobacter lobularis]